MASAPFAVTAMLVSPASPDNAMLAVLGATVSLFTTCVISSDVSPALFII